MKKVKIVKGSTLTGLPARTGEATGSCMVGTSSCMKPGA